MMRSKKGGESRNLTLVVEHFRGYGIWIRHRCERRESEGTGRRRAKKGFPGLSFRLESRGQVRKYTQFKLEAGINH